MTSTTITMYEIATSVRHLQASVRRKDPALFDDNAAYLRSMVEALIRQQRAVLDKPSPVYIVRYYDRVQRVDSHYRANAGDPKKAVLMFRRSGFDGRRHIVTNVEKEDEKS